jgi:tetratricopeptide (TPR) repeat protein
MNRRVVIGGAAAAVILLTLGAAAWWAWPGAVGVAGGPAVSPLAQAPEGEPLPVPPVPPRIAQGAQYEQCLAMLPTDPAGARDMAETWQSHDGGEAATHCLALSKIELGDPQGGAEMLEALATSSHAPDAARAEVFDQADEAWLVAGDENRAFAAATLALTLLPDDVDLLVNHAVAAGALQRYADAQADLSRALDLDPKRTDALVLRGSAWRHLGRLDLAQADVGRALAADPDDTEALLERGILRQRANDEAGAREDWERAISLAPDTDTADLAQQDLALLDAGPERQ